MHVPESAPKDKWYVPPGFIITKHGTYVHIEHDEVPITVRDTISDRDGGMTNGRK